MCKERSLKQEVRIHLLQSLVEFGNTSLEVELAHRDEVAVSLCNHSGKSRFVVDQSLVAKRYGFSVHLAHHVLLDL